MENGWHENGCATQSVGKSNQLLNVLIQTIIVTQCNLSTPDMWPEDYGPTAIEKGNFLY